MFRKGKPNHLALVVILLAASMAGPVRADGGIGHKIEAYFAALTANRDFNGVVLLSRDGQTAYQGVFGSAGPAGEALSGLSEFRIASLTKTFTSGAILLLEKEGKLNRKDPIEKYLPGFPRGDVITIRLLLMHASGLSNPDYDATAWQGAVSTTELVANIAGQPFLFEPGSRSQYSNAGFNVLARIIEVVSGQSYGDFLTDRFFGPLGMTGTRDGSGGADNAGSGLPGYVPGPGPDFILETPLDNLSLFTGSGSIISTAPDLTKWAEAIADERFFSILDQEWPYGWGRVETAGYKGIEQTGAVSGFVSVLKVYPDQKTSVVLLSNVENGGWFIWGNDLATILFGGKVEPGAVFTARTVAAEAMARFPGRYEGENFSMRIEEAEGLLWAYFWWAPEKATYLTTLGPDSIGVRAIGAKLLFSGEDKGPFSALTVQYPWDDIPLQRTE